MHTVTKNDITGKYCALLASAANSKGTKRLEIVSDLSTTPMSRFRVTSSLKEYKPHTTHSITLGISLYNKIDI